MKLGKLVGTVRRGLHAVIRVLAWVAACSLSIMVLLTVGNVLARFLFKKPLSGSLELIELLTVVVICFALAYAEVRRRHIYVELVVSRLSRGTRRKLASITDVICIAFFAVLAWNAGEIMWTQLSPTIRVTDILSIPFAPFMFVVALGSLLVALAILINCLSPEAGEKDEVSTGGKD